MRIISILVLIIYLVTSQGACSPQSRKAYGNASMMDRGISGDITWLMLEDQPYCFVAGTLEGSPDLLQGAAGFSGTSLNFFYYYEVFPLKDYPGLVAVHCLSYVNLVDEYSLYASKEAKEIPAEFIWNFPATKETFVDEDSIVTVMNGGRYASYGTTGADFQVGDLLFSCDGRDYAAVPGHPEWIAAKNQSDERLYDLFYDVDAVTALPVDLLFTINGYVEQN